jgi:hypothetical protein
MFCYQARARFFKMLTSLYALSALQTFYSSALLHVRATGLAARLGRALHLPSMSPLLATNVTWVVRNF